MVEKETWINVEGESMRPVLCPGDRVAVQWEKDQQPLSTTVGSIVLLREESSNWILHRVVGKKGMTKGDFSCVADGLPDTNSWARVVRLKRRGSEREHAYQINWLDRWIACLSRWSLTSYPKFFSKIFRKTHLALGVLRRWMLLL